MMKFLAATIAALSIAAITTTTASVSPSTVAAVESTDAASTPAKPLMLAQRRGKCTEDLGYGRTGSYGCG
jgi:hypothetical protein